MRVISATNADLRGDDRAPARSARTCTYRLNVIELRVPPLAERPDDILPLAEHFLAVRQGSEPLELADDARARCSHHDWPGNVRELKNRVQRATPVCADA